ncbi:MAG TPA: TadE family protein [Pyrinomonadaceae bacterium]|nr:TadE family protein [Pyrinomonadaceae bacterium]
MCPRVRKIRLLRRFRRRLAGIGHNERGVQLLELAIVLPIFMILFAATAEFGRYFYEYTTLSKAARVGARYLVTQKVDCAKADLARNLVVYGNTAGTGSPILPGLLTSNISITPNDLACAGTPQGVPPNITVTISGFKHQSLFNLGGLLKNSAISMDIDVKPSISMRYMLSTPLV